MKKIHLAAWALGVMTTAALAQAVDEQDLRGRRVALRLAGQQRAIGRTGEEAFTP